MSIFNHFTHINLSNDQQQALSKLEAFIDGPTQVFQLKGYAGSGKTTILKGMVEYLSEIHRNFALMAPTGRAAKVIRERTGQEAFTIHKTIYSFDDIVEVEEGESFFYYYKIRNNTDVVNKIFIVDEASMLSDMKSEGEFFRFGSGYLLSDLVNYTRVGYENVKSKIIFVGDPCQLPPVGDNSSKAFDKNYLRNKFNLSIEETEMKEVKRQGSESGILKAAAKIRKSISAGYFNDFNLRANGKDIQNPTYEDFLATWQKTNGSKIIIAYKNKTCLDLNLQIRKLTFGDENLPVQIGDIVIMGSNNYYKGVFNGEFAVVNNIDKTPIRRTIALRGIKPVTLSWRIIELLFPDNESSNKVIEGIMLENFLYGDNTLRPEESQALYVDFKTRHPNLKPKTDEFKMKLKQDDYFNCLLMKFGYAVTCHKAQGGEWDSVFTIWDHDNKEGFNCFTDKQQRAGKTNHDFYRWGYTALTRASNTLYALNPPLFNSYSTMAFVDSPGLSTINDLSGGKILPIEIQLDNDLVQQLQGFNLMEQPLQVQDHFIKIRHAVRKHYIEIFRWERIGYEVRYYFERQTDKAVFKTFINSRNEFPNPLTVMEKQSPNPEFNRGLQRILQNAPNISVCRDTSETILTQLEFEFEMEELFPFTRNLFDDLTQVCEIEKIHIENIDHQPYKERYTFKRNQATAVVDFEYNQNGFFGRVIPIKNQTNSLQLVSDIKKLLQTFKQEAYAN